MDNYNGESELVTIFLLTETQKGDQGLFLFQNPLATLFPSFGNGRCVTLTSVIFVTHGSRKFSSTCASSLVLN